jgi:antitoxin YefM
VVTKTTYAEAHADLEGLWDQVVKDREPVIISCPGAEDVALIPTQELSGLLETIHLLRSPANAERLLAALREAEEGVGVPMSIEELCREVGLDDAT